MSSTLLNRAPDESIGLPSAERKAIQVMQLDMSNEVLEELLASAHSGKQPQIMFGRNPVLRFGSRSHVLDSRPSKLRQELYQSVDPSSDSWEFAGLVSHSLSIKRAEAATAGMDAALQTLKHNMAAAEQERESRKTRVTSDVSALKSNKHLAPRSQTTSTSRLSHNMTDETLTRKSASVKPLPEVERAEAIRVSLIHLLALQPLTLETCSAKLRARSSDLLPVLKRLAEKDLRGEYVLTSKGYKEVNPWAFSYTKSDRQTAIDNAIKAYDRLRIDPKESIWQTLLPEAERNKGTILSKLKIQPVKVSTPGLKPKIFDKKTGLPKRSEPKKTEKTADVKAKEKDGVKAAGKATSAEESKISGRKSAESEPKREAVKEKRIKLNKSTNSPAQHPVKEPKPSTAVKSLLNKPRNPSPLSKSPPVNASDFEDNHPVHKALSAAVSPSKPTGPQIVKRKAIVLNNDLHRIPVKKPRIEETFHITKVRPSPSPAVKPAPSTKRKPTDDSSSSSLDNTPLKLRKVANGDSASRLRSIGSTMNKTSARPRSTTQTSDESSATSPDLALSHRDRLELADKFKRSYARYEKLYREVSNHAQPASSQRRDELLKLHSSLAKMKKQVTGGVIH